MLQKVVSLQPRSSYAKRNDAQYQITTWAIGCHQWQLPKTKILFSSARQKSIACIQWARFSNTFLQLCCFAFQWWISQQNELQWRQCPEPLWRDLARRSSLLCFPLSSKGIRVRHFDTLLLTLCTEKMLLFPASQRAYWTQDPSRVWWSTNIAIHARGRANNSQWAPPCTFKMKLQHAKCSEQCDWADIQIVHSFTGGHLNSSTAA